MITYSHLTTYKNNWQSAMLNAKFEKIKSLKDKIELYYNIPLFGSLNLKLSYNKDNTIKPEKITLTFNNTFAYITVHSERYLPSDIIDGENVTQSDLYPFFNKRMLLDIQDRICSSMSVLEPCE